jgi:hypothetical protein
MHADMRQLLSGWMRQFGAALVLYLAALAVAIWASTAQSPGPERTLLIAAPILPGLALIGLTIRSYRRSDEFFRLRVLQAAALATVVVAAFALVYTFLELLGLPRLSAAWTVDIISVIFVAQMLKLIATGK